MEESFNQTHYSRYDTSLQRQNQYGNISDIRDERQRQPQHVNQRLGLTFAIAIAFVLACMGGVMSLRLYNSSPIQLTIQDYYEAIKIKDYNTAYGYFASNGTIVNAQGRAQRVSIDLLKNLNAAKGELVAYVIRSSIIETGGIALVTVSVQRHSHGQEKSYDVYLKLSRVGENWKIVSTNGI